ncbi:MAG: hypothetical protein M3478_15610 [Planctomycetota bacterium]|nr:hypothetical protein [Planctomycetota bacterium]
MTMSTRERSIATITGIIIGSLVLYQFVVEPKLTQIELLDSELTAATTDLERADSLFNSSRSATKQLAKIAGSGLRRNDAEAESELLNSTRQWAQEAGLSGWGIKREATVKERDFNKITFRAQGSGGMGQIGRFLYRLQTANIPVRIVDMTVNSRRDGTDDLAIVLGVSTIYLAPESEKPAPRAAPIRRPEVES